jgi:single-stranded-DNA-specific exonuclease
MRLGILCLLAGNPSSARALATELDALNKARREIEADMREDALASLGSADVSAGWTVVAYDPAWHQGVIGIVAARLRDRFHRPAVVLAPGEEGELKGSGRSVPGLHLRDCLDLIAKREPALLLRFGGHAAAAGLTLKTEHLERFEAAFEAAAATLMSPEDLQETLWADGALTAAQLELDLAEALDTGVWGKDFPEPVFQGEFTVLDSRIVGEKHLKLRLGSERQVCEGILFGDTGPLPAKIRVLYQLAVNEWNGVRKPQLTIRRWEAC